MAGILVSSKANSQSEAIQLAFLTFLPSIFFSGYIFPRETMPTFFYVLSFFIPASYYINFTRGIILRGAGLSHLWLDGLKLFIVATCVLTFEIEMISFRYGIRFSIERKFP